MLICTSQMVVDHFSEQLRAADPELRLIVMDDQGNTDCDEQPEVLFVYYDMFFASEKSAALVDSLERIAAGCAWVQTGSAGYDHHMLSRVKAAAPNYCNAAGIHAVPIAQYVLGNMLRWSKRMDLHWEQQCRHQWKHVDHSGDLTGATLGIVGFGGIGQEVARLGKAFGMRVLGIRRTPALSEHADQVLGTDQLDSVLAESDYIVLVLPHSDATEGLIGVRELGLMKESAMLINVGRGSSLDEGALMAALSSGELACAALDTTREEPLPEDSLLWDAPNCFITPHNSPTSPHAAARLVALLCDNIRCHRAGKPLRNLLV